MTRVRVKGVVSSVDPAARALTLDLDGGGVRRLVIDAPAWASLARLYPVDEVLGRRAWLADNRYAGFDDASVFAVAEQAVLETARQAERVRDARANARGQGRDQ